MNLKYQRAAKVHESNGIHCDEKCVSPVFAMSDAQKKYGVKPDYPRSLAKGIPIMAYAQ